MVFAILVGGREEFIKGDIYHNTGNHGKYIAKAYAGIEERQDEISGQCANRFRES